MEDKQWIKFKDELHKRGIKNKQVEQIAWCAYNIGKVVGEYEEKSRPIIEELSKRYSISDYADNIRHTSVGGISNECKSARDKRND